MNHLLFTPFLAFPMYLFMTNASRPQQAYQAGDLNPTHPTSRLKLNYKKQNTTELQDSLFGRKCY